MATLTYPQSHISPDLRGIERDRFESGAAWKVASLLREAARTRDFLEMLPDFLHPVFISKKIAERDATLDSYASALCPSSHYWAHETAGHRALRGVLHLLVLTAHDGLQTPLLSAYQNVTLTPAHIASLIAWLLDLDIKVRADAIEAIAHNAASLSKNRAAVVRSSFGHLLTLDARGQSSALEFAGHRLEYLMPPHYVRRALPSPLTADGTPTFVYALPKFARRCGLLDLGPTA